MWVGWGAVRSECDHPAWEHLFRGVTFVRHPCPPAEAINLVLHPLKKSGLVV